MNNSNTNIVENKPDHHYRSETPNIVMELGLSLQAVGLYTYLKKIAGDCGSCWKRQSLICDEIGVAPTTYIKYRDELIAKQELLGGKPLVIVNVRKKPDGSNDTTTISIVDVWRENGNFFRLKNKVGHPKSGRPPIQILDDVIQNLDGEEEPLNKISLNKDIVTRMPSFKEKKEFKFHLNPVQRKLHDQLMKYKPEWGKSLESNDVCAWFLREKNRFTVEQVEIAFKVYKQDAHKAKLNGHSVENMGGSMVSIIKLKRTPDNEDMSFNREFAEKLAKEHSFLEITQNYVKIRAGNLNEEIIFNLPHSNFVSQINGWVEKERYMSLV